MEPASIGAVEDELRAYEHGVGVRVSHHGGYIAYRCPGLTGQTIGIITTEARFDAKACAAAIADNLHLRAERCRSGIVGWLGECEACGAFNGEACRRVRS